MVTIDESSFYCQFQCGRTRGNDLTNRISSSCGRTCNVGLTCLTHHYVITCFTNIWVKCWKTYFTTVWFLLTMFGFWKDVFFISFQICVDDNNRYSLFVYFLNSWRTMARSRDWYALLVLSWLVTDEWWLSLQFVTVAQTGPRQCAYFPTNQLWVRLVVTQRGKVRGRLSKRQ